MGGRLKMKDMDDTARALALNQQKKGFQDAQALVKP